MSDLEKARPGKIGKTYPAHAQAASHDVRDNQAPVQQQNNYEHGSKGLWIALIFSIAAAIAAVVCAILLSMTMNQLRQALADQATSAVAAQTAAVEAARASERALFAERA